jgi:hypothetical protein
MSAPEDFDARTAFGHLTDALDPQATLLQSWTRSRTRRPCSSPRFDSRPALVDGHLASLDRKLDQVVTQTAHAEREHPARVHEADC